MGKEESSFLQRGQDKFDLSLFGEGASSDQVEDKVEDKVVTFKSLRAEMVERRERWEKWFAERRARKVSRKIRRRLIAKNNLSKAYEEYRVSREEFVQAEIGKIVRRVLSEDVRREVSRELLKRYRGPGLEVFFGPEEGTSVQKEREVLLGELYKINVSQAIAKGASFDDLSASVGRIGSIREISGSSYFEISLEGVAGYTMWDEEREGMDLAGSFLFSDGSSNW